MTLSQFAQFGSISRFTPPHCTRNEAWPIHVIPISPSLSAGHSGVSGWPARRVKIEGMKTSVMKLRLCQAPLGVSPTFVEALYRQYQADPAGIEMAGESNSLMPILVGSDENAAFGAVSRTVFCVTQGVCTPLAVVVQPAGSAGAVAGAAVRDRLPAAAVDRLRD